MDEDKLILALRNIACAAIEALEETQPPITGDDALKDYDLSCLTDDERKAFTEILLKIERHQRIKPIRSDRISP